MEWGDPESGTQLIEGGEGGMTQTGTLLGEGGVTLGRGPRDKDRVRGTQGRGSGGEGTQERFVGGGCSRGGGYPGTR